MKRQMTKVEKQNTGFLTASGMITRVGDILFDFANNSFLASLNTSSMALVGLYQAFESIVGILFNLFGGVIADRFHRKKIIIMTDILSGLICIGLSFIHAPSWMMYAVVIANGVLALLSSFSGPAYKAFTKEVVEKENISKLNSYLQTGSTIVKITVPIIAISLYHILGIQGVLFLDGLTFLFAALMIALISPIIEEVLDHKKMTIKAIFKDLATGFQYLFRQKEILMLIILAGLVNFFLAGYNLVLPYGNQMFPDVSGNVYGSFLAAEAVGGLLGASLSGVVNKNLAVRQLLLYLAFSGLALVSAPLLYLISHEVFVISLSPALFSFFLTIFNIQFFSIIQSEVDNDYLGRVFGIIFTVAICFMPLGSFIFTAIFSTEATYNIAILGLAIFCLALLFLSLFGKKSKTS